MSEKSYKLAQNRIRKDIEQIISEFDIDKSKELNKNIIGNAMNHMGVYKHLYNNSAKTKDYEYTDKYKEELQFHTILWELLKHPTKDYISSELFVDTMMILFESNSNFDFLLAEKLYSNIIHNIIELVCSKIKYYGNVNNLNRNSDSIDLEKGKESVGSLKIIKAFKELCNQSFYASAFKWLRSRKISKFKKSSYTFKPEINEETQVIVEKYIKNCVEKLGTLFNY